MNALDKIISDKCLVKTHIARELNISPSTIMRICDGKITASYEMAKRISDYFNGEIAIGDIMSIQPTKGKQYGV